jgi:hypothetical protein
MTVRLAIWEWPGGGPYIMGVPNPVSKQANKVNRRAESGLRSHCIRLLPFLKPDRAGAFRRKGRTVTPLPTSSPFSEVRFASQ